MSTNQFLIGVPFAGDDRNPTNLISRKKTKQWVAQLTQGEKAAKIFWFEKLQEKAKQKPFKILKFYKAIIKRLRNDKNLTFSAALKALYTVHMYVNKGPPAVLTSVGIQNFFIFMKEVFAKGGFASLQLYNSFLEQYTSVLSSKVL